MCTHHSVVHPGREEGVDGRWVDQLSVVGEDCPEKKDDKLKRNAENTVNAKYYVYLMIKTVGRCFLPCPQGRQRQRR